MMTKRRAESESLPTSALPQMKKCRSVHEPEVVHAPPALFTTLIGERRRKRPRCCEDREQGCVTTGAPVHKMNSATDGVDTDTDAHRDGCVSGKFRRTSDAFDMTSGERACKSKSEESTKETRPDENEDELCAFNSFQFWRSPLPALDLSLLDGPSTTKLDDDASLRAPVEEMET